VQRIRNIFVDERFRVVGGLAALALFVLILWPRPQAGKSARTTTLAYWQAGNMSDIARDAIEQFERTNPDIEVIVGNAAIRNPTDDPQRFLTGVAGGVPPDVIYFDRYAVAEWASRGAFEPLDKYLAADRRELRHTQQQLEEARRGGDTKRAEDLSARLAQLREFLIDPRDFYEATWNEAQYDPDHRGAPKLYGIPASADNRALYYNETALKQAGFVDEAGHARPPRTWEEVLTKIAEAPDGQVAVHPKEERNHILTCASLNFVELGVRQEDHVSMRFGTRIRLAQVLEVLSPHELKIRCKGALPAGSANDAVPFKVFKGDSYLVKLSRWDRDGLLWRIGLAPVSYRAGNSWLYMFGWQNGGRFMSPDGRTCTLNDPKIVQALAYLTDCYDALGGYSAVSAMESSYQGGWLDPFLTGKVAMRIDGNYFLITTAQYNRQMDFGVAPAPMPQAELAKGRRPISWMGGWVYAIPSTARHKDAAWKFIKWMVSRDAFLLQENMRRDIAASQGQIFVPQFSPRRSVNAEYYKEYVTGNPPLPERFARAYGVFGDLLPQSYYRPVTPVGQLLWNEHRRATERALSHNATPQQALDRGARVVQAQLDQVFAPAPGPAVRWGPILLAYAAALVLTAGGVAVYAHRRGRSKGYFRRQWYAGWAAAAPWMLGFVVFIGGPMLFSLIMSFTQYDVINPAHWAAGANYKELARDPLFYKSLGNTAFMALGVPLGIVLGLGVALLLDAGVRGLSAYRTLFYLPAIVPAVAASILWLWVFHPTGGLVNTLLAVTGLNSTLSGWGLDVPLKWLQQESLAKPALIIMGLWGVGGGMLIWLAGLKSIPEELYEAAAIDGAGPLRRFVFVTLPMLTPYIFFNLIMGTIGVFQAFTQAYIMTEGGPNDATLFYAYNLFNQAFRYLRMGYASALAWVLFAIIMVLTLIQLKTSKRWVHYEAG
jgi:ABC-type sugar transport system permease subunit/ABC-type glycerol-3-phosphate transport system substrate-binding protein